MAAAVVFEGATGIPKQPGVTHPTPGLLHQMTATPWLVDKLRPRRIGTLLIYVRLPSGQLSSYKVESKDTVGSLKKKVAATAVARALGDGETEALLYMGRELGDDETFEGALVADRAMLVRPGRVKASAAELEAFVEKAKAPTSDQLYERIKYEPKRGLDLDYDVRSWPVRKSKFYSVFVLNHRVVLHAVDAMPARWRGNAGSYPLDRARSAASSRRNDLVKNCRAPDALVDFHTGPGTTSTSLMLCISRPSTASPNTRAPSTSSRATKPGAATTTTTARATRPS